MHIVILFLSWGKNSISRDAAELLILHAVAVLAHSFCSSHGAEGYHISKAQDNMLSQAPRPLLTLPVFNTSLFAAVIFCQKSCTNLLSAMSAYNEGYKVFFKKIAFQ